MVACQATFETIDNEAIASDHLCMIANRTITMHLITTSPVAGRVEGVLR